VAFVAFLKKLNSNLEIPAFAEAALRRQAKQRLDFKKRDNDLA
jgi:hypothetical protein